MKVNFLQIEPAISRLHLRVFSNMYFSSKSFNPLLYKARNFQFSHCHCLSYIFQLLSNETCSRNSEEMDIVFPFIRSHGKFYVSCLPTFPLSLLNVTHLKILLFTDEWNCITQNPYVLISFSEMFLSLIAAFWWHNLVISSASFVFLGNITGCDAFASRFDYCNLSPVHWSIDQTIERSIHIH